MRPPSPDTHQRLAEVGRVLIAAHRRREARAKKKIVRPVVAAADEQAITGKDPSDANCQHTL